MADECDDQAQLLSDRLGQAIPNNELENIRMYIEQGLDPKKLCYSDVLGENICPLALACYFGREEILEELLKAGADPNQVSGRHRRPVMHMASEYRPIKMSMIKTLMFYGADVNLRDKYGMTILYRIAWYHFNETDDTGTVLSAVKLLLDNGASVYARADYNDCTPLYWACTCDNVNLVKLFIAEGADVNVDIGLMTMLRGAADGCNSDIFDLLLNAGANRQLTTDALIKPCTENDHAMILKILDTCDIDINMPLVDFDGDTILHHACSRSCIASETVRLLLDRGADIRAVSVTKDTALHCAVMYLGDCNKIRQLLSYNHPLSIENNANQTPLATLIHFILLDYRRLRYTSNNSIVVLIGRL